MDVIPMRASPGIRRRSGATASSPRCRCCGSSRRSRAACCGGWRSFRPRPSIPRRTRSPARFCMRPGPARWRCSARCRSVSIMAPSMRRPCSCCWPAPISTAPATGKPSPNCGLRSKQRCRGSTGMAMPMATASSNTGAQPNRDWPIRAGRTRSTRSSVPTAAGRGRCRAGRSPGLRVRGQARGSALREADRPR